MFRSKKVKINCDRKVEYWKTDDWSRGSDVIWGFKYRNIDWLLTTIGDSRRLQENTKRHVWVTLFTNTSTHWSLQHSRVLWWHDTHTSSSCFTARLESFTHTHLLTHSEIMRCIRYIPDPAHCDASSPPSLICLGLSL